MPIGSTTSAVNMVNIVFTSALNDGQSWQSTAQMIPMGINGDPAVQLARLRETVPHMNNLRLLFNEYSFNADGSLHPAYESFLAAAAAQGYQITFVYAGGDAQNIGLNGWVNNAGNTPIPGSTNEGAFFPGLTNAQAYTALQAQFTQTQGAWTDLMDWLEDHPTVQSAVYGYEVMNEAAGYRHSIDANGAGQGLTLASFVQLYADHCIALSNLIQARDDANILVEGWGYGGDFATLNTTVINGVSALNYLRAGIGADLIWSAHLYPGWAGTGNAADPTALAALLDAHFAPLTGNNVIVTETNISGTVDDPSAADDVVDFFAASFEWFADNGIGIGWFPFNSTGASSLIWFESARLQFRHQHSLAHAMNAFSLGENPAQHVGNQTITASTFAARLHNEDYEAVLEGDWDSTDGTTVGQIGWAFGYAGNDTMTGTNMSNDFMYGGTGNDSIMGLGEDDFLFGQDGNDTLRGSGGDHLFGGRGNDYLSSSGGRDVMRGGAGNDTYLIDGANDVVRENANHGTDTILTSVLASVSLASLVNIENLTSTGTSAFAGVGNAANNVITSGAGNDTLTGADGNDALRSGAGVDSLYGGNGNDTLTGGAGADRLDGGAGSDWASYATATAAVNADLIAGRSALQGDAVGDVYVSIENLQGGNFNDTLRGNDSANVLLGGDGNDRFWARGGNDTMTGGAGADVFAFETGYGADRITDFQNNVDDIFFSKMGFTTVSQAMAFATQSGAHVVFNFGSGNTLTVLNMTLANLVDDIIL